MVATSSDTKVVVTRGGGGGGLVIASMDCGEHKGESGNLGRKLSVRQ